MDRILATDRLILRPLSPADAEPSARLMTPDIARWTGSWRGDETASEIAERIARYDEPTQRDVTFNRAAVLKATGDLIGWIGMRKLDAEPRRGALGYWIGEPYFGQGYTREAARAVLAAAWEALDLDVVEGVAQLPNAGSIAILRGLDMRHVGQRQEFASARGKSDLCECYEIERPRSSEG